MPEVYLPSGAMVVCSEEDYDLIAEACWRVWSRNGVSRVVRDATSKRCRFRLYLHREVAFRIRPELVRQPARMNVTPLNGDFLDVRRENLEIAVRPRIRGGTKRPAGHRLRAFRGTGRKPKPPPAWARAAAPEPPVLSD